MRILITGACGFVGSTLAAELASAGHAVVGVDNFIRPGSEENRAALKRRGVNLLHGDIRCASDLESWPNVDAVIDAAANPSVLAGIDGKSSSRQVVEHNLGGTVNLLEFCKARSAAFVLLSTSRVYSVPALATLPLRTAGTRFALDASRPLPAGVGPEGIDTTFGTQAPVSLYGATKLASEQLALEYGASFAFPVFVNRCGVLAGAGQFGRPDQGIFAFWLNSHLRKQPLRYLGFGGTGHQVRDCLHPRDLVPLLLKQLTAGKTPTPVIHCSGGLASARSLRDLTDWCEARWGKHTVVADGSPRPFDLPWVVLSSKSAKEAWGWEPTTAVNAILDEIAAHAEAHPDWLALSQ
ncbi:NAD-dependent epimerase/dehydratase family protein [Nibricoccus sp. IMCC34717]|uniref:NAD-dependent epimerase/dehydratase family protein n=1 Tax=Nibricoccus sp. IMCC34717 TaxID=3034021 RepID=UPI00384D6CC5